MWIASRYETAIIWLEDIDRFDYVRQSVISSARRAGRPRWSTGRLVGYSELAPTFHPARPYEFPRRAFWVARHDRSEQPNGVYSTGAPTEAVDPRTVAPGVVGEQTPRVFRPSAPTVPTIP